MVTALHDGGSEGTIMTSKTFYSIPDYKDIKLKPQRGTYLSTVTGDKTPVIGSATIFLRFTGDNGTSITFPHEVYIHDNIEHEFILGRDFTGSQAKLLETRNHMYLTAESESSDIENFWDRAKHTYCDVPLLTQGQQNRSFKVYNTETIVIPPYSPGVVTTRYEDNTLIPIPAHYGRPVTFEVQHLLQPRLETPTALYQYVDNNNICFTVYNDSHNDFILPKDIPLAQIQVYDEPPEVHNLQVTGTSIEEIKSYRAAIHTAEFIEQDSNLTEEEKLQGFHQYVTSGHYPVPMTTLIENTPSLTNFNLIDDKPLTDEELVQQFKISHLAPRHKKHAINTFLKYKGAFSRHDYDLGRAKDIEMDIELIPNPKKKPQLQSYFPLPHTTRKPMKDILNQMLKYGIIRECHEPSLFVSNILIIDKKEKNQFRMLLDGRLLNEQTVRYPTNLVSQPEVIAHISGRQHITTVDVSHAFFQVPINERSQPYTAFFSPAHGKRYCFQRCPQGLKNSPLYLKLLMDKLLGDLSHYVLHYADDILIASDKDLTHHIDLIGHVLQRLEEGGIKIRPSKLHVATDSVDFLGIKWQQGKLNIPEARVLAFKQYPKPTTAKQTKSFVCAMSYYRRFLPNFAEHARPLLELTTQHHKQFKWTQEHDIAFYKLIDLLVTHTSLNIPDPAKPFYVQTDASDYCGAGRVFQKDDEGNELLMACVSRTFTKAERKYGVFRKVTLALLYALKSMDFFLRFANKVIILVDAKSILFLRMCKDSAGILLRFSLELSKYEAEIFHVPGKENEISDILSCNHIHLKDLIAEEKNRHVLSEEQTEHILRRLSIPTGRHFTAEEVKWLLEADSLEDPMTPTKKKVPSKAKLGVRELKNIPKTLPTRKVKLPRTSLSRTKGVILPVMSGRILRSEPSALTYTDFSHATRMITSGEISVKHLIMAQKDDPQIGHIMQLKKLPNRFTLIDNVLYDKVNTHYRLALPQAFLHPLINAKHFSVMGLHFSKSRIARDILTKYFVNIRALKTKLQLLKENCILCQFNANSPQQHPLTQTNLIYAPRVTWACDIIPSLPQSKKGNNAMFLAVDMFTGYIQLAPINSRATPALIEAILETIIRPFGIPKYFRCDSETGMFSSLEFRAFMEPLGIKFLPCSVGAPWSNGAAERAVQTIKLGVRKFVQQEHALSNWDEFTHFFSSSHNKSTSVYGFAPEQLHFGFTNPSPTDLFQLWPNSNDQTEYMNKIVPAAEQARAKARERQDKAMKSKLTYRNQNLTTKTFRPGQLVLQRNLQLATGPGKAMQTKYNGPYIINLIDKDQSSALIEHMHTGQQVRAHFSNITLLNFLPQYHKAPNRYDEELLQFIPEKYSYEKYFGSKTAKSNKTQKGKIDMNLNPTPATSKESDSNSHTQSVRETTQKQKKDSVLMPGFVKHTPATSKAVNADNTTKIEIIMPSILKDIQGKLNITLPPHILQINNDPKLAPQQANVPSQPAKQVDTEMNKERRSTRIKKPPDKLRF